MIIRIFLSICLFKKSSSIGHWSSIYLGEKYTAYVQRTSSLLSFSLGYQGLRTGLKQSSLCEEQHLVPLVTWMKPEEFYSEKGAAQPHTNCRSLLAFESCQLINHLESCMLADILTRAPEMHASLTNPNFSK